MEYKTVILSVLIMSLVLAQIQVEATKACCRSMNARRYCLDCMAGGGSETSCAISTPGCIAISSGKTCPPRYPSYILENPADSSVNAYCKLGCATSVCGALTSLQNSGVSEFMNGAVEQCTKTCSTLCNKGSVTEAETA